MGSVSPVVEIQDSRERMDFAVSYECYEHNGVWVWVRTDLKGTHEDYCLCHNCEKHHSSSKSSCEIAESLRKLKQEHGLITPVFECPEFVHDREEAENDEEDHVYDNFDVPEDVDDPMKDKRLRTKKRMRSEFNE